MSGGGPSVTHMRSAVTAPPPAAAEPPPMSHMRSAVAVPLSMPAASGATGAAATDEPPRSGMAMTHMRSAVTMPPSAQADAGASRAEEPDADDDSRGRMAMTHMRSAVAAPPSAQAGIGASRAEERDVDDDRPDGRMKMTHMRSAVAAPPSAEARAGPSSEVADERPDGRMAMTHMRSAVATSPSSQAGGAAASKAENIAVDDDTSGGRTAMTHMGSAVAAPPAAQAGTSTSRAKESNTDDDRPGGGMAMTHMRSAVAAPPAAQAGDDQTGGRMAMTHMRSAVAAPSSTQARAAGASRAQDLDAADDRPDGRMKMTHMRSAVASPPSAQAGHDRPGAGMTMTHMRSAVAGPPSADAGDNQTGGGPAMSHMRSAVAMPPSAQAGPAMTHMRSAVATPPSAQAGRGPAGGGPAMTHMRSAVAAPPSAEAGHDPPSGGPAMSHMRSAVAMPPSQEAGRDEGRAAVSKMRSAVAAPPPALRLHKNEFAEEDLGSNVGRRGSGITLGSDQVVYMDDQFFEQEAAAANAPPAMCVPPSIAIAPEVHSAITTPPALISSEQAFGTSSNVAGLHGHEVNTILKLDSETLLKLGNAKNWHLSGAEVCALLRAAGIDPVRPLNIADIRAILSKSTQHDELKEVLLTALRTVDTSRDGYFRLEDLRQALSLSFENRARLQIARLHGRDPSAGHWVSREGLVKYLEQRRIEFEQCASLPFALIFFVLFFCLMIWHTQIETARDISSSMEGAMSRQDLSSGFPDSTWTWLASHAEWHMVTPNTTNLGGVRLTLLGEGEADVADHKPKALCKYSRHDFHWDSMLGTLDSSRPKLCGASSHSIIWLHWPLQRGESESALLEARKAWEAAARSTVPNGIAAQFLAYSSKLDFYALYTHTLHFDPSGLPLTKTSVSAFDAKPVWLDIKEDQEKADDHLIIMGGDLLFLAMIVAQVFFEFFQMFHSGACGCWTMCGKICKCCKCCKCCQRQRHSEGERHQREYFSIWVLCRWVNIIMAVLLVFLYDFCEHETGGLNKLVNALPVFDEARRLTVGGFNSALAADKFTRESYELQLSGILEQSQRIADAWDEMYWYVAVMAVCTCIRLVDSCRGNPRLNITISTLRRAAADISHLFILLLAFVSVFVLVGHMIYGSRIEAFSNGYQALESTTLFLAGFTYNSLHSKIVDVGGTLGIVWMFVLNIIILLVLMHVVMGMVSYLYLEARHEKNDTRTLKQQLQNCFVSSAGEHLRKEKERSSPAGKSMNTGAVDSMSSITPKRVRLELQRGAHPDPVVSTASLAAALGAGAWADGVLLDYMLSCAKDDQHQSEETASVADTVRMCSRVDTNVRVLDKVVRDIGSSLESANLRPGLIEIPVLAPLSASMGSGPVADDVKVEDLTSDQPPMSEREAPPAGAAKVEDAPFEGVTFGETWDLEEHLEERVAEMEKSDAANCAHLEKQIAHLGDLVNNLHTQRFKGIDLRRDRMFLLENMLEDLSDHFRPLFDDLP